MNIATDIDMMKYGEKIAKKLPIPSVIELLGDVGAGKTTFTRGLAEGLGVNDNITSPSFNISKRYAFRRPDGSAGTLIHYDFYRLPDPGIMYEEISEALQDPSNVIVVEWGESVSELLPENHYSISIKINDDGSRKVESIIGNDTLSVKV